MQKFTFATYKQEDGHPPQDHILWDLPADLEPHRAEIIQQAGLKPDQAQQAGVLTMAWKTHPENAIVLAPSLEFMPGQTFAVSREGLPLPT